MKTTTQSVTRILGLTAISVSLVTQAFAQDYEINWWTNSTSRSGIYQYRPGSLRLENTTMGHAEGMVVLPHAGPWEIEVVGWTDEFFSSEQEVAIVTIDISVAFTFTNWPARDTRYTNTFTIAGSSFSFRYDFSSPFNINHAHLEIMPGIARPVRERLSIRCSQTELCWPSLLDRYYQVQYKSALTTNQWIDLGGPVLGNGTNKCITDPILLTEPQRFYQVIRLP